MIRIHLSHCTCFGAVPLRSSSACCLWSVQRWSPQHNAACSRGSLPLDVPYVAETEAKSHRKNYGTIPRRKTEGKLVAFIHFSCFFFSLVLNLLPHLKQAESAWAELVFALTVFKWEKLDELVNEHWVWEMVKDDLLPLSRRAENKSFALAVTMISHHCVCYIFPRLVCMHLCHFLSGQVLRGLLLLWRIHHQVSGEQLQS